MKRNKIMFVIAIVAILAVLFVACDEGAQPEHTHTYGAWSIATQPTETTTGTATRACVGGDNTETVEIANLSDATVWTVEASQDATHTAKGFKVYKSIYGTVTVTTEKTTEHTYGAWTLTKNPTATETGTAKRTCACGDVDEVTVAVLTDASVWTTATSQDPTHESKGFVQYTSVYGTVLVEVAAGQHTFNNWTLKTAPTLTETGLALKTCVCGHYEEETVAVLTDTTVWTKQHTDATHAAAGSDVYTSVYGSVTIVIPQVEHNFTGELRDNGDGTHSRKCTGCDAYSNAVAHDFSKKIVDDSHKATEADCTNAATYYYSCECGAVSTELTFESGKAVGHNYSEFKVTKEPTCTETGTADSICSVCGDTQSNTLAALGHKYTNKYEQISFEYGDYGVIYQHAPKCDVCGYVNESASKDHTYDNEHFHVTSGDQVYEVCNVCGYYDDTDPISSLSDWTVKERVVADYNQAGYTIYTDGTRTYRKDFAKLVAPYDGKTYTVFELKINDEGAFNNYHWSAAQVTLNEKGEGTGSAFPLNGTTKFTMVDPTTGAVRRTTGSNSFEGYVDFETGIIITTARGLYDDVYMFVPVESGIKSEDINGSILAGGIATSYTTLCNLHESHTFNILINDESVLFGVKFEGKDGNVLNSADCESADYVKVYAKDGKVLAAYQKNASGTFQETDGKEGAYNDVNFGEVVLNGIGGATIGGKVGVYSYNADKAYYELYVGTSQADATAYYTFTLAEDGITVDKPMTAITYDTAYGADTIGDEYKQANNNVKFTLPVLTGIEEAGENEFVGWTIDGQEGYVTEYTPNGTAVTFTAVWKVVYTVTIIDGAEGVESINVPDDEVIYDRLPDWDGKVVENRKFVGWFVDVNGDGKYTEADDDELDETMVATSNITLIAVWKEIPAYVGTYYGGELYNAGYGNYGKKTLTIDMDGNISSDIYNFEAGKVISYDPITQKLTWTNGVGYFDVEAKVLLGFYKNSNSIGNDYYFFGQNLASDGKVVANYGIYAVEVGGTATHYYAQFIQAKTALGDNTNIFTYGNKIYSGVEIKDIAGNPLVIDKSASNSIAKSASVLVYKDGKVVFARVAGEGKTTIGDSGASALPRELDAYFGTYTCEDKDNLVLDGVGGFTWGAKTGTYTETDAETKKFDLYVVEDGKNIEYYTVTLNGSTYTAEKPMVTVTYTTTVTPVETLEASVQVNKNIEITLPALTNADNMFRGWLIADSETLYNGAYTPKDNVDFTAKWDTKYTFKAVYNDGTTADVTKEYGEGDTVNIDSPVWAKHRFDGWFTTATFDEGTEWTSGTKIVASFTIYAKWSDAEAYYNTYLPIGFSLTSENGGKNSPDVRSSGTVSIDAFGLGTGTGFPFNGSVSVKNFNKENGTLVISVGSSEYNAYIDNATGIIVRSQTSNDDTFAKVWLMSPFEKSSSVAANSSYWNGGKTRVIEYTYDGTTYRVFINNGKVYFGTSFMDAVENGNAIAAENCYNAKSLFVFGSDGEEIARFAYNGTTMVATDGAEGTYMDGDTKIVLNGAGLIDIYNQDGGLVSTGTYSDSGDSSYQYDVILDTTSHKLSIDRDAHTVTKFENNNVTITYMDGDNVVKTDEGVYKLIESDLWADYKVEGFVFRGWYLDGDESQTLVKKYTATGNATFVAKLDPVVSLTIVYGNGLEDASYAFGAGDALDMSKYQPAFKDGKAFSKWYTTAEMDVEFTAKTITENTTVYCGWIDAAAAYGSYNGWEVWSNSSAYSRSALKIDVLGKLSGYKTGTIVDYNDETGYCKISSGSSYYYAYYDKVNGLFVYADSSNVDNFGSDAYFYFKDANTVTMDKTAMVSWNSNKTRLIPFVVDGVAKTVFINNDKVYGNVKVYDVIGNEVSVTKALNTNGTTIVIKQGDAVVAMYRHENGSFNVLESDGKAGTYTSDDAYGDIVLDGYGALTINGKSVSYVVDGDKVTFVVDNAMKVITLSGNTYVKTQDGYQGTYTLPDGSTMELDGYGNAGTGTYVVNGANITIYDGATEQTYGIDVAGKVFLGKSVFANYKFVLNGMSGRYVLFNDSPVIAGRIEVGYTEFYIEFANGVLSGNTLTVTVTAQGGNMGNVGKTITFTVSGNTLTVSECSGLNTNLTSEYNLEAGTVYTCEGFSL